MLSPDIRPFLGAMDDIDYVANTITLEPGDYLFLYTDGITEAFCEDGTYYGDDRLKDFLKTIATEAFSAEDIVKAVIADVESFTNGFTQSDDIAALAVRFNPVASRTRVVSSEDTIAIVS